MPALLSEMRCWADGNPFEQRAAAAGLCEPILLADPQHASAVLDLLDQIMAGIPGYVDRKAKAFRVLRKGLAYCWSVAVAALPVAGKPIMERWIIFNAPDISRIMKQNLQKTACSGSIRCGWSSVYLVWSMLPDCCRSGFFPHHHTGLQPVHFLNRHCFNAVSMRALSSFFTFFNLRSV